MRCCNPYKVIREEFEEVITSTEKRVTRKVYDSQSRLVLINTSIETNDGIKMHHFESVSSDGYWSGGTSIEYADGTYISGETVVRKFEDSVIG